MNSSRHCYIVQLLKLGLPLWLMVMGARSSAQPAEAPAFQAPHPTSDPDFDDLNDEYSDLSDPAKRAAPPPPPPPPNIGGTPAPEFRPSTPSIKPSDDGKVRFHIVEGQFYEKGKRRGRANQKGSPPVR